MDLPLIKQILIILLKLTVILIPYFIEKKAHCGSFVSLTKGFSGNFVLKNLISYLFGSS